MLICIIIHYKQQKVGTNTYLTLVHTIKSNRIHIRYRSILNMYFVAEAQQREALE